MQRLHYEDMVLARWLAAVCGLILVVSLIGACAGHRTLETSTGEVATGWQADLGNRIYVANLSLEFLAQKVTAGVKNRTISEATRDRIQVKYDNAVAALESAERALLLAETSGEGKSTIEARLARAGVLLVAIGKEAGR